MKRATLERRQLRGPAAIADALDRGAALRFVLCLDDVCEPYCDAVLARCATAGVAIRRIAEPELRRLVPAEHETVMLALEGPEPASQLQEVMRQPGVVWLVTGCKYPGNAGFVIRNAEVSGGAGVVIAADFDRIQRRDCLRYGMRVDRFFPVHFASAEATLGLAREAGRRIVAVEDVGKQAPWDVDLRDSCLVVLGGEQGGVPQDILDTADTVVRVPMCGFLPSYNLQAAMSVVMGERLRQLAGPRLGSAK